MSFNFSIGYQGRTACLTLLAVLALSGCGGGNQPNDTAAGNSPSQSVAQSSPSASTAPSETSASSPQPSSSASTSAEIPGSVKPTGTTCPSSAPIKGNITKKRGKIYFEAKYPDYKSVKPEVCFADTATAQKAGFRAPGAATKTSKKKG